MKIPSQYNNSHLKLYFALGFTSVFNVSTFILFFMTWYAQTVQYQTTNNPSHSPSGVPSRVSNGGATPNV